ncbi:unnamed protein product [Candidula unifasciata]|uniref:Uncharacterized protein n=1 Tax=Candidula unifasciata TaxID=100452 RepID=A0A8S3Z4I3_9EUPU|nr:unnamed protein product [Candidula unifasciata]
MASCLIQGWVSARLDVKCLHGWMLTWLAVCLIQGWVSARLDVDMASCLFSQLSRPDMLTAWHTECHRRCRYQLTWTINLSCQFDPYRIPYRKRRAIDRPSNKNIIQDVESTEMRPWNKTTDLHPTFPNDLPEFMTRTSAASFLNSRRSRRHKRNAGIMEECCINKACSWEEFGEYCQRHPRSRKERDSVCVYN